MVDRKVVEDYLTEETREIEIPKDISKDALIEAFCIFVEDDFYEWLKDNFKTFFNHGNPDWNWILVRIKKSLRE